MDLTLAEIEEHEANRFAIELLIPLEFLAREVEAMGGVSLVDDKKVIALAKKFEVPIGIMVLRLIELTMGRPIKLHLRPEKKLAPPDNLQ